MLKSYFISQAYWLWKYIYSAYVFCITEWQRFLHFFCVARGSLFLSIKWSYMGARQKRHELSNYMWMKRTICCKSAIGWNILALRCANTFATFERFRYFPTGFPQFPLTMVSHFLTLFPEHMPNHLSFTTQTRISFVQTIQTFQLYFYAKLQSGE